MIAALFLYCLVALGGGGILLFLIFIGWLLGVSDE